MIVLGSKLAITAGLSSVYTLKNFVIKFGTPILIQGSELSPEAEMAPGKKCWGAKTVRVPTASEASKIFTGHTFQIGLKCDYTL